ncbi:DUF2955 domain-containing protein [Neptunicella marina]|uniref:DUF2955 domain-containing protein n=1 Tax=Neptunicella marina TaxID=2125989 RepID=A0A8J6ISS2_9ALTE|nr:DUF2955 domain-containing protein [Neptunicella marina]MBC3765167.1 DUF2955 domain-containing protein [Neptunicella marina]
MSTNQEVSNSRDLSPSEQRRLLRIALGSCSGFVLCKLMNWPYGVFFTVYPMLLLGMLPVFNRLIACQFLFGCVVNIVELYLLQRFFLPFPLLMSMATFVVFAVHFYFMAKGKHYLMWACGLISLSTMLHFGSYPDTSIADMATSTMLASIIAVISAAVLYWLIPEHSAPAAAPPPPTASFEQIRHRTLLGATLATLSFVVFQVMDLRDSLSAQVATILVLFPLTFSGSLQSAINRAKGVTLGCALGIVVQIMMYDLINHFTLVVLAFFMTVLLAARLHLVERAGSGMGFGALTTIGILFGQYMQPHGDILYSSLYRLSSVVFALAILIVCAYAVHRLLNQFASTRDCAY